MIRNLVFTTAVSFIAAIAMDTMPRAAMAQAPGAAANGATPSSGIICKDGTTWTGKPGRGACRGHHGVDKARTRAAEGAASNHVNTEGATSGTPGAAAGSTAAGSPAASEPPSRGDRERTTSPPAAGGGAGQVWVNTTSKVYHCPGTRWYGKTKHGKYMSESEARRQGDRPDHGKSCS